MEYIPLGNNSNTTAATIGAGTAYPSELYLRECPTCGAGTAYPSEFTPGCVALSLDLCFMLCRSLF